MKLIRVLLTVAVCAIASLSLAQTKSTSTQATISDEDLRKYAITMDSVKGMQQTLQEIIAENVRQNTVMEVQRYNQLFKIEKDSAKLAAANATPEERAFLKEIAALRDYNLERINKTYQALAKDYVGLKTFNAIRKSLETDENLKARYDAIAKQGDESESASTRDNTNRQ